jgi:FMN phosphatase YigB (HAD superfamily)
MSKLLITDLDNTLYNLIDYFGPSFRGMVHALSRVTKIDEEIFLKDFKQVFLKRESLEYSFGVQELEVFKTLPKERVFDLIELAQAVFKRARHKNLKPYDTVVETLEWLNEHDIIIVGMSNAPFYNAEIRLKQLFIDKYFYGLAARENLIVPDNEFTFEIVQKNEDGKYKSTKIKKRWVLKKEQLKPNTFGYKQIMEELRVAPENTFVIGDSMLKDVQPAIDIGANGIWAKYGEVCNQKNLDTVLSMTNWNQNEIKQVFFDKHNEPELVANRFSDLKKIMLPNQLTLFNED